MKTPEKGKKEEELTAGISEAVTISDRELILSAQSGDLDAFEELIQKYDRRILSLAFSYTRNSDDAKDIYQETLIRAYRSLSKFEMKSQFSTWIFRIATNVCMRFNARKRKHASIFEQGEPAALSRSEERPLLEGVSSDTVEGNFMRAELQSQIEKALETLSPMQRLVFAMKHYEGYKLREIAVATNCAEGTVKKHLFEAVRRLQKELEAVA